MSLLRSRLESARGFLPVLVAAAILLAVIVFLFANPLVSAALALAVPLTGVACILLVAGAMNRRLTLWHGRRPFYFSLADLGFLGCFVSFAFYAFANVQVSSYTIAYVGVGVLIIALTRFVFMEFEAWLLGLAFAAVLLLITGQFILFTLFHPAWFFDFVASLSLAGSLGLIVFGSVMSWFDTRRTRTTEQATAAGRKAVVGLAVAFVLSIAVSGALTLAGVSKVAPGEAAGAIVIEARDGELEIDRRLIAPGQNRLLLRNSDLTVHNFTLYRYETTVTNVTAFGLELTETRRIPAGLDVSLGPGSEKLVTVDLQAGKEYGIVCEVPGHLEGGVGIPLTSP